MPAEKNLIEILFHHNLWSNMHLFDACLELDLDQLKHADPGTYGSILETLQHIVDAEDYYYYLLTRVELPADASEITSIAALKALCHTTSTGLQKAAATIQPDTQIQRRRGEETEVMPANVILLQTLHHAHEHRTQVNTLLGQLGIEPPEISGWSYYADQKGTP